MRLEQRGSPLCGRGYTRCMLSWLWLRWSVYAVTEWWSRRIREQMGWHAKRKACVPEQHVSVQDVRQVSAGLQVSIWTGWQGQVALAGLWFNVGQNRRSGMRKKAEEWNEKKSRGWTVRETWKRRERHFESSAFHVKVFRWYCALVESAYIG